MKRINVAASTKTLDVDNRISLRYYFRIADNVLKQANIFRAEKNYIDLYIMLLRFSSLVTETIPRHRDYRAASQSEKNYLKKKTLEAVIELESLKPTVELKIDELSRKHNHHVRGHQTNALVSSQDWPSIKKLNSNAYVNIKAQQPAAPEYAYQNQNQQFSHASSVEPQFRRFVDSGQSDSDDDLMKQIDDYKASDPENVEKFLCNFNIHISLISSQLVELTKIYRESSATFNKHIELLCDEVKVLRMKADALSKDWRKAV